MAWAEIEPGTEPLTVAIGADQAEWELCRQIPGAVFGKDDSLWRFPLTWPGLVAFRCIWQHQPITIYPELAAWEGRKLIEIRDRVADRFASDATDDTPLATRLWELDTPGHVLTPVQRAHVQWLTWRRCVLADARGGGKTPPLIRALQVVPGSLPALVVAPPSSLRGWERRLAAWAPELRVVLVQGTAAKRRKALDALKAGEADVAVIAWPNVRYHTRLAAYPSQAFVRCNDCGGSTGKTAALCEVHPKELNEIRLASVILDEAHAMADPRSKQTRAAWWLAHHAENCWAVTGTIQRNDVGELWPVMHAVEPLAWPVRSKYLDLYAVTAFAYAGRGTEVLDLRADNAEWFHWALDPYIRRVPPEVARAGQPLMSPPEFRYPEFTPAQARIYAAFRKEGLAELEDAREVVPLNTAVKFTRMYQVSAAAIELADTEDKMGFSDTAVRMCAPSCKVDDLVDFLAEEPGQWVVAAASPQLIELAAQRLLDKRVGVSHTRIIGGMSGDARDSAAQAFANGEYRVIFITPGAGGEALDGLQVAEGIVWMQPTGSWAERDQANGRVDRFGRTAPARQVHMITPGSTDPRVYRLGCDKAVRQQEVAQDAAMLRWLMSAAEGEIVSDEGDDHDHEYAA
jgi:SNF2 family DNA or RNA helicase